MSKRTIPFNEIAANWRKDSEYRAAYAAIDSEFTLAELLIRTRSAANMSQEDVARAMGTKQSPIARLESGCSQPNNGATRRLTIAAKIAKANQGISFSALSATPDLLHRVLAAYINAEEYRHLRRALDELESATASPTVEK